LIFCDITAARISLGNQEFKMTRWAPERKLEKSWFKPTSNEKGSKLNRQS
jgi:hypothetical protein